MKAKTLSPGLLERTAGPCVDAEQRIKDLYIVNTVAGWAKNQLRILGDMAADHKLPEWYVKEVERIGREIETVAARESARRPNAIMARMRAAKERNRMVGAHRYSKECCCVNCCWHRQNWRKKTKRPNDQALRPAKQP